MITRGDLGVVSVGYWHAFRALVSRDLVVLRRDALSAIVRMAALPLLYAFIFGYLLPRLGPGSTPAASGGGSVGGAYSTVLLPGLLATVIVFQGIGAVSGPLIRELTNPATLHDRLLTPVPLWVLLTARTVSGAVQALLAAVLIFPALLLVHPAGQAPAIHVTNPALLAAIMLVGPLFCAALGLGVATWFTPRTGAMVNGLVLLPMSFLGCIYYPWSALHAIPWLQAVSLADPVTYLAEALRASLTPGVTHLPAIVTVPALLLGTAVTGLFGARCFHRRTHT